MEFTSRLSQRMFFLNRQPFIHVVVQSIFCLKFVIAMLFLLVFVNFFERIVSMENILSLHEFLSKFPGIQLQFFQLLAKQLI